jgi:hypothetical protein
LVSFVGFYKAHIGNLGINKNRDFHHSSQFLSLGYVSCYILHHSTWTLFTLRRSGYY